MGLYIISFWITDLQFGSIEVELTFERDESRGCIEFPIFGDDIALEPTEVLLFTLSTTGNRTFVQILDDDGWS